MNNNNYNESRINLSQCEQTELLIDEHIEGMISLKDKEAMDEHLVNCDACSDYLKETSSLVKNLSSLPAVAVNLSVQNKNDLWSRVESKIDINKYKNERSVKAEITSVNPEGNSFFFKYRYILSGCAAVLVLLFIIYGVKNMKIENDRLSQQSAFGFGNYWKVSNLQGNSLIGDAAMSNYDSIKEGQWVQTNYNSRAELVIADIGKVIIEPNSKVVFLKSAEGDNRILVEYGTINTDMNPNAKNFFVEMPSAVATDNGGSYTLTIDSTGDGLVYVKSGKVEIESPNREAIIPAGMLVLTKKDVGVGTPFNENSSAKFKNALFNFDFGNCAGTCVATLLNNAKMSDAVSLVNMIPNVDKEYSDQVYTKLATFVAPPKPVPADSIPFLDEDEINEWIEKIQVEVQQNVEKSMKDVEKSLEQINNAEYFNEESLKDLEDFAKNWKFQIKTSPEGTYVWEEDSLGFDKEQFKKDMDEMKLDIEEYKKFNKEQLKEDMDELKEDLQEMRIELKENLNMNNEELKKELEKANEEMRKAMKEVEKINIPDSVRHKIKIKSKDGFEYIETPEVKETPETPETPETEVK